MTSRKVPVEFDEVADRDAKAARLLATLGSGTMTRAQAKRAGQLLDMHWTHVYRLRGRFVADPVASAVSPRARGPKAGNFRIEPQTERVIQDVLERWLPRQKQLAHPLKGKRLGNSPCANSIS